MFSPVFLFFYFLLFFSTLRSHSETDLPQPPVSLLSSLLSSLQSPSGFPAALFSLSLCSSPPALPFSLLEKILSFPPPSRENPVLFPSSFLLLFLLLLLLLLLLLVIILLLLLLLLLQSC